MLPRSYWPQSRTPRTSSSTALLNRYCIVSGCQICLRYLAQMRARYMSVLFSSHYFLHDTYDPSQGDDQASAKLNPSVSLARLKLAGGMLPTFSIQSCILYIINMLGVRLYISFDALRLDCLPGPGLLFHSTFMTLPRLPSPRLLSSLRLSTISIR